MNTLDNDQIIKLETEKRREIVNQLIEYGFYTKRKADEILSQTGQLVNWTFDFRPALLNGKLLNELVEIFWKMYENVVELQIVSIELAGVPLMSAILSEGAKRGKKVNGLIVRKSAKKYGLSLKIEGNLKLGVKTVFVDDLVNSGTTVEKACVQLQEFGIRIEECFFIMSFESKRFEKIKFKYMLKSYHITNLADYPIPSQEQKKIQLEHSINHFKTVWVFDPKLAWNKHLVFAKSSPLVINEIVYWGTDANILFANSVLNGEKKWLAKGAELNFLKGIWSSPASDGRRIFYGSYDGCLRAVNLVTGQLDWQNLQANFIGSSPAYSEKNNKIYLGLEYLNPGFQGAVAAFAADSGEMIWEYKTRSFVHSSPKISEKYNLVICGSNEQDLMAFDSVNGNLKWKTVIDGTVKFSVSLSENENYLFASATDGIVYQIESLTGNIVCKFKTSNAVLAEPLLIEDKVVIASCDNAIYVYDIHNKQLNKKINTSGRLMAHPRLIENHIFMANNNGLIIEMDTESFDIIGQHQLPDRVNNALGYCHKNKIFIAHTGDDRIFGFVRE